MPLQFWPWTAAGTINAKIARKRRIPDFFRSRSRCRSGKGLIPAAKPLPLVAARCERLPDTAGRAVHHSGSAQILAGGGLRSRNPLYRVETLLSRLQLDFLNKKLLPMILAGSICVFSQIPPTTPQTPADPKPEIAPKFSDVLGTGELVLLNDSGAVAAPLDFG